MQAGPSAPTAGRTHEAARVVERGRNQLQAEKAFGLERAGQTQRSGRARVETEACVAGSIADQQHCRVAKSPRFGKCAVDQLGANAAATLVLRDRDWSEKERRPAKRGRDVLQHFYA